MASEPIRECTKFLMEMACANIIDVYSSPADLERERVSECGFLLLYPQIGVNALLLEARHCRASNFTLMFHWTV